MCLVLAIPYQLVDKLRSNNVSKDFLFPPGVRDIQSIYNTFKHNKVTLEKQSYS